MCGAAYSADAPKGSRPNSHCAASRKRKSPAEGSARTFLATGEKLAKRDVDAVGVLTAQEEHIARLAREGRTNPEIGAELFLSARTVEWHLRKVFAKLGITSRKGLQEALSTRSPNPSR